MLLASMVSRNEFNGERVKHFHGAIFLAPLHWSRDRTRNLSCKRPQLLSWKYFCFMDRLLEVIKFVRSTHSGDYSVGSRRSIDRDCSTLAFSRPTLVEEESFCGSTDDKEIAMPVVTRGYDFS